MLIPQANNISRWATQAAHALSICTLALISSAASFAQTTDELLEPDQAFAFSAQVVAPDQVQVAWKIAPGYYMYLDKFIFEADPAGAKIARIELPKGKIKKDEFFGDVEIFEDSARIDLALARTATDGGQLKLKTVGQGCNEPIGVCYAPISHTIDLTLPTAGAVASSELNSVADLQQLLGVASSEPEFLDPDQAFSIDINALSRDRLTARFIVAPGYYLYRDKIDLVAAAGGTLGEGTMPSAKLKQDPYFGDVQIYEKDFVVELPLVSPASASQLEVIAHYQGCADQGICYPPIKKSFTVALPTLISDANAATTATTSQASIESSPGGTALPIGAGEFVGYLLAAFGTGLLLSFTPCVLPLIPILLGSVVGQAGVSRGRSTWLASVYVLGTVITYAAIGAVAGATGEQLQAYFQNIWAIGAIAIILSVMALSMFGLFEIQMPSVIQSRLSASSRSLSGSGGMVLILGALSALIVGACVSPLLISVLSIAILKGDPWLGGALMAAMALGMGVILIAAGAGASWLIPKSGIWMERVKQSFGVMLLAVAVYLLGVVPEVPVLLLWSALLIITGIYLGAARNMGEHPPGWMLFSKGVGTVMLIWGVLAMIGGFSGNRDILAPVSIQGLVSGSPPQNQIESLSFQKVVTLEGLGATLASSRSSGEKVLLDFYADWCTDCLRMEKSTFKDQGVQRALADYRLLKVDVTDPEDPGTLAIKKHFGVFGPPAMLFFGADGVEHRDQRLYGFMGASDFARLLNNLN